MGNRVWIALRLTAEGDGELDGEALVNEVQAVLNGLALDDGCRIVADSVSIDDWDAE